MPADDEPVGPETLLYRRIEPSRDHLVPEHGRVPPCKRVSTAALCTQQMSVVLGDMLDELDRDPESILDDRPDDYLIAFPARFVLDLGKEVRRAKTDDEPAHGLVVGALNKNQARRLIANEMTWVGPIPPDLCD